MLGALFFAASVLYSSVGHGGASGYLAAMGLFGIAPAVMRPTALVMNIAVASISLYKFWRSSGFNWRLFWPFAVTAVPMAFVGGRIQLPILWFGVLVGCVLLFSATRLFIETLSADRRARSDQRSAAHHPRGGARRCDRPVVRADGSRRRNFFEPASGSEWMGDSARQRRAYGSIRLGEFGVRLTWITEPTANIARRASVLGCRRHCWRSHWRSYGSRRWEKRDAPGTCRGTGHRRSKDDLVVLGD